MRGGHSSRVPYSVATRRFGVKLCATGETAHLAPHGTDEELGGVSEMGEVCSARILTVC